MIKNDLHLLDSLYVYFFTRKLINNNLFRNSQVMLRLIFWGNMAVCIHAHICTCMYTCVYVSARRQKYGVIVCVDPVPLLLQGLHQHIAGSSEREYSVTYTII